MSKFTVLSLFDGLSGARIALDRLGIDCKYYASEVDKYAIQISSKNYPDIIHLGDVRNIKPSFFSEKINLLIGGSPCQDLCLSKHNRKGLQGERSGLFFEYVRLLKELQPDYFLLENVASMKTSDMDTISNILGVYPILINSSKLTAQHRKRLYWTNIKVMPPMDKKIYLKDIIENGYTERQKSFCITATYDRFGGDVRDYFLKGQRQLIFHTPVVKKQGEKTYRINGKPICFNKDVKTGLYQIKDYVRKLTPVEAERLQGIPDNYTAGVSNQQRYKMIGNGFTIPVIEHILRHIWEKVEAKGQLSLF